jgi:hypothetical protein
MTRRCRAFLPHSRRASCVRVTRHASDVLPDDPVTTLATRWTRFCGDKFVKLFAQIARCSRTDRCTAAAIPDTDTEGVSDPTKWTWGHDRHWRVGSLTPSLLPLLGGGWAAKHAAPWYDVVASPRAATSRISDLQVHTAGAASVTTGLVRLRCSPDAGDNLFSERCPRGCPPYQAS